MLKQSYILNAVIIISAFSLSPFLSVIVNGMICFDCWQSLLKDIQWAFFVISVSFKKMLQFCF